jgi:phospholipid/cholesterol/gamma-HCH transport system substrate-binding protein
MCWRDVGNGVVKSFVFGVICTAVALYQGHETEATPEGVAYATTPHGGDLLAVGAGDGLRADGVDVLHALRGTHEQTRDRDHGGPVRADGHGGLLFLALKAANLASFGGGQGYRVQAQLRQHRRPQAAFAGAQRRVVVGRVTSIGLDPKTFQGVVTMEIDSSVVFPKDSSAKILTAGLLGDQYIGIEAGVDDKNLAAGDTIRQTQSAGGAGEPDRPARHEQGRRGGHDAGRK